MYIFTQPTQGFVCVNWRGISMHLSPFSKSYYQKQIDPEFINAKFLQIDHNTREIETNWLEYSKNSIMYKINMFYINL